MAGGIASYHGGMAMTLRLTEEETEALRRTAEREHRSMQDVARSAVVEYTTRRERRREEILQDVVTEHAGLLRRLAE